MPEVEALPSVACKELLVRQPIQLIVAKREVSKIGQPGCELLERIALETIAIESPARDGRSVSCCASADRAVGGSVRCHCVGWRHSRRACSAHGHYNASLLCPTTIDGLTSE